MTSRSEQSLIPRDVADLAQALAEAHRSQTPVGLPDLRRLTALVAHVPEDMTATVEAGMTLGALQDRLLPYAQWVPIDPPRADSLTIGTITGLFELADLRQTGRPL